MLDFTGIYQCDESIVHWCLQANCQGSRYCLQDIYTSQATCLLPLDYDSAAGYNYKMSTDTEPTVAESSIEEP